jgi:hypothetical protein
MSIPFSEQRELDKILYGKYFKDCYIEHNNADTFNKWYHSDSHLKYINSHIRKMKLEKIKKADI